MDFKGGGSWNWNHIAESSEESRQKTEVVGKYLDQKSIQPFDKLSFTSLTDMIQTPLKLESLWDYTKLAKHLAGGLILQVVGWSLQ